MFSLKPTGLFPIISTIKNLQYPQPPSTILLQSFLILQQAIIEKQQGLFNDSYKVKIIPLIIYRLEDVHTHFCLYIVLCLLHLKHNGELFHVTVPQSKISETTIENYETELSTHSLLFDNTG